MILSAVPSGPAVERRPDGSIDHDHYRAEAARLRRGAVSAFLDGLVPWMKLMARRIRALLASALARSRERSGATGRIGYSGQEWRTAGRFLK